MKKLVFLSLLLISSIVYGQERTKPNFVKGPHGDFVENAMIPIRDTVIMYGEKIEIGSWFIGRHLVAIEVVNFGKSKKKDFEKGFYVIKQKPKQTTTYTLVAYSEDNHKTQFKRTVYVAKNEEEKRKFEELAREKERERNELLKGKRQPDGRIEIDMSKFR